MTLTIDKSCVVKSLLCGNLPKVFADFRLVAPVANMALDVVHHFHYADVGTTMTPTLQRANRSRNRRIRIRVRRRNNVNRQRRVVTATVLSVQDKRKVKNLSLKAGITLVAPYKAQKVFRSAKGRGRIVNIHALSVVVAPLCLVSISRKSRKAGNKLNTLAKDIRY